MLPEWLPNVHPLIVHLPIGLLVGAVLIDLVASLVRRRALSLTAVILYVLGALGTGAAYLSGQRAADTVDVPTEAMSALTSHEDWAFYTLIFFGAYALIRIGAFISNAEPSRWLGFVLWLLALPGMLLLWQASERGGELVFAHGVGVSAAEELRAELNEMREAQRLAEAEPVCEDDGSWDWRITEGADAALKESFTWIEGDPDAVELEVVENDDGSALEISGIDGLVMVVIGDDLSGVEIEGDLNTDAFEGTTALIHNVTSSADLHYWRRSGDTFAQGRLVDGEDDIQDEESLEVSGWFSMRATGVDGHFYGYVNGETVTHTHTSTPDAGQTGLLLDGEGTVMLRRLAVQVVE